MRKLFFFALLVATVTTSCDYIFRKTVHGNGNLKTEERNATNTDKIKSLGNFDIDIVQGSPSAVKVCATDQRPRPCSPRAIVGVRSHGCYGFPAL